MKLGVDYTKTISCYDPKGNNACGLCDACKLRLKGFAEAGTIDRTKYI
jgi:7-cyano-7-deazaguanine synthase